MKKVVFASMVLLALASCGTQTPKMDVAEHNWEGVSATDPVWAFRVVDGDVQWEIGGQTGAAAAAFAGEVSGTEKKVTVKAVDSDFTATLHQGECSDGVTNNVYTYTAKVEFDGETYTGCGREYTAPQIEGAAQQSITVETGSGTEATITNTAVQVDGQVVGAVTVSTGSTDTGSGAETDPAVTASGAVELDPGVTE